MSLPLISFNEYKESLGRKNLFNGHFWTTDGDLFEVKTRRMTTRSARPGSPFERHPGFLNRDTFYATEKKRITITLKEIGDDDVVYDENGDFVCTRPGHNPERKGVIYIRRYNKKRNSEYPPGKSYKDHNVREYEDLLFQSGEAKRNLNAEAFSKIFTHILSMDTDIKKDLKGIRNGKVSVEMEIGGARSYYNMTEEEKFEGESKHANAFGRASDNIVVALISPRIANADDTYATIWNVLNLLGVHEMKHVTLPWTGKRHETHHLNYIFQKAHHSWKNTTPGFKNLMNEKLTDFYKRYKNNQEMESNHSSEKYRKYREFGIYPPINGRFEDIESQLIRIVKDDHELSIMDDYFRKKDEKEGRGDFYKHRKR